jgi:hypothetical protein
MAREGSQRGPGGRQPLPTDIGMLRFRSREPFINILAFLPTSSKLYVVGCVGHHDPTLILHVGPFGSLWCVVYGVSLCVLINLATTLTTCGYPRLPPVKRRHDLVDHAESIGHGPRADQMLILHMDTLGKGLKHSIRLLGNPSVAIFRCLLTTCKYIHRVESTHPDNNTQDGRMGCADARTGVADRVRNCVRLADPCAC